MRKYDRISPALVALAAGLSLADAHAEMTHANGGRLGGLRTPFGQLSQGLSFSLAQGLRYDSNIVRTAGDAETQALYGKSDSSDWVSQTGANVQFNWKDSRTVLQFIGDVGYAHYFSFDQFSGWVASGAGVWTWHFTQRCSSNVDARAERSLADFADLNSAQNTFQTSLSGAANVGCFILDRVRVSVGVFGDQIKNDNQLFEVNDLNAKGYEASLALVSARHNEVGVHYRHSQTERPHDPIALDITDESYDVYGILRVGQRTRFFASLGRETNERQTAAATHRSTALVAVSWEPSAKLAMNASYERAIENAPDLIDTQRKADRVSLDLGWRFTDRMSAGAYAVAEDDTLDSAAIPVLTGVEERTQSVGVYFQHSLFQVLSVKWTAGASHRDSDQPLREYKSETAGVSIGIGF